MIQGLSRPALALGFLAAVGAVALSPALAAARGGVAFGFGFPIFAPPLVYPPPPPVYYPPPPVVYYPPPPVYAPPAYAPAPAAAAAPAAPPGQTCREYQSSAIIDGQPQTTYGTACLQPDGSWRIVR